MKDKKVKEMLIRVTDDHIKNGVREDECECPIALAIEESLRCEFSNIVVAVYDGDIHVRNIGRDSGLSFGELMFKVEPKNSEGWDTISDFIHNFDKGEDVRPFQLIYLYKGEG